MKRIALTTVLGFLLLPTFLHAEKPLLKVTAAADPAKTPWLPSCRQTAVTVQRQALFQSCDRCYGQPFPDSFCRKSCGCHSAFCGAW